MSTLRQIRVQNFRSHNDYTLELSPKTTIITGKNGSGKTSLLEAIYISLQGSSFRGTDKEIVKQLKDWYRVDASFEIGDRVVKFDSVKQTGKKQFISNNRTFYRLPASEKKPIVLFEPEDLRLLSGSPTRRRLFIDRFISQIDPLYHMAIRKYDRALKQRNNLLKKNHENTDELFVWNVALGEYGSYIINERIGFIERLNQKLTDAYQKISNTTDQISVHYSYTLVDDIKAKIIRDLALSFQKDSYLGYTTIGPHRDDLIFRYNDTAASEIASRGENRTIILALKYLEMEIIRDSTGEKPIILLDDVFSELDDIRQSSLSQTDYQTIITSTNAPVGTNSVTIAI